MDPFVRPAGKVEHLVVDAGGFIRNVAIQNLGEKIYTLPEVVAEIRDRATKERLAVLPYELIFREPPPELIKMVSDFAKKTGDYASLSATDIKVIALTLLLEKEHLGGLEHIHTQPIRSQTIVHTAAPSSSSVKGDVRQAANTPGFFIPKPETTNAATSKRSSRVNSESEVSTQRPSDQEENLPAETDADVWEDVTDATALEECVEAMEGVCLGEEEESRQEPNAMSTSGVTGTGDFVDDDDDDAGWITPSNVKAVYKQMGLEKVEPTTADKVGCLTGDFSMQNVIMQMGMHVIGPDGMVIKTLRTYVFRCFACYKVTHDMSKQFCAACGHQTLKRVAMTVDKNGQPKYHISTRRPLSIRGTKFSLPLPKGGKHAVNPILCEDQPVAQFRAPKKSLRKLNVFDPDYVPGDSPFLMTDLTSRAALLGRRGLNTFCEMQPWMAKNPNACRRPRK
ncbi:putative 20S-pre-rRNA D-site endonuclease nob1 [Hypsibius exemplaris]|uniref:RNA-binding protein NOB1 n=1 Tax=Hypsibius exemplaris TaxID=2072580 RepID=A0A1W0X7J7_HYPEX|nr:putative 20S-pre-rRNA D-site endonuclease nob1 [Hypsibius exemplaris]